MRVRRRCRERPLLPALAAPWLAAALTLTLLPCCGLLAAPAFAAAASVHDGDADHVPSGAPQDPCAQWLDQAAPAVAVDVAPVAAAPVLPVFATAAPLPAPPAVIPVPASQSPPPDQRQRYLQLGRLLT